MLFLFIDLMTDSFKGLPIWYWWGGATSFAIFFGRHLDDVKKSSNKGEPPKEFEWGASLGISMFWVFIPVFGAGWVAYKLIKLVMK
jgi:hypothetical protein